MARVRLCESVAVALLPAQRGAGNSRVLLSRMGVARIKVTRRQ
jgi:hypothetical protein